MKAQDIMTRDVMTVGPHTSRPSSWINESYISVTVNDGVVELWGFVDTAYQHSALRALVEETDG